MLAGWKKHEKTNTKERTQMSYMNGAEYYCPRPHSASRLMDKWEKCFQSEETPQTILAEAKQIVESAIKSGLAYRPAVVLSGSACIVCKSPMPMAKRKFCSENCSARFWRLRKSQVYHAKRYKNCIVCNVRFEIKNNAVTCTPECSNKRLAERNKINKAKCRARK